MQIDKSSFVILVGTLAAGGAGGYVARDRQVFEGAKGVTDRQPESPAASSPTSGVAASMPATATCDDSVGSPGTCPPPGYPAEEGGCGALPSKRCADFKDTMKPKVAERAVACLNALKPAERCDANRLSLCEHEALMSACGADDRDNAQASPSGPDDLAQRCQAVQQVCAGAPVSPTLRECRATMAGLTELGRARMVECMRAHCGDRGLLGCEAMLGGT